MDEAVEAAVVLDILCTVLLIPQHIDEEGLKYVMWVCRRLQVSIHCGGGKIGSMAIEWGPGTLWGGST